MTNASEIEIDMSVIKAARANWLERKIIRLDRKCVIVQGSILVRDGDHKLVILHNPRHDMSQRPRIQEDQIVLNAFAFDRECRDAIRSQLDGRGGLQREWKLFGLYQ